MALEIARRCTEGSVEQHRRDEQHERQLRIDLDRRRDGREGKRCPGECQ